MERQKPSGPARRLFDPVSAVRHLILLVHLPWLGLPYFWDEAGYYVPAALDLFHWGSAVPHSVPPLIHPPLFPLSCRDLEPGRLPPRIHALRYASAGRRAALFRFFSPSNCCAMPAECPPSWPRAWCASRRFSSHSPYWLSRICRQCSSPRSPFGFSCGGESSSRPLPVSHWRWLKRRESWRPLCSAHG